MNMFLISLGFRRRPPAAAEILNYKPEITRFKLEVIFNGGFENLCHHIPALH